MEMRDIDTDFFHPVERRPRDAAVFQVVTVASLIWQSGYEYTVEAVHRLRKRDVDARLWVAGEGPEQLRLLYTIDDLRLNDVVQIAGRLSPEERRRWFQQADVFLYTGLCGDTPSAIFEAMACGLPVVTMDGKGQREEVTDGVEGWVIPIRNAEAMADALYQLATRPVLRVQMGQAARQRIVEARTVAQLGHSGGRPAA